MFALHLPRWTAGLRRAAALVKAFALLEDAPRSATPARRPEALAPLSRLRLQLHRDAPEHDRPLPQHDRHLPQHDRHLPQHDRHLPEHDRYPPDFDHHLGRPHPHRRALTHLRARRDGAVAARPAACTMPIGASRGAAPRGDAAQNARWAAQRAAHR